MEDLLDSKEELLRLAQGCATNYKHNKEGSTSFVENSFEPKKLLIEELTPVPSIIGSKNIHTSADSLIKAISAVTYKIGTLAENLDTKLSQLSDTIMFLEKDVEQVRLQISHTIEGGYQKEFREIFGCKAKKIKLEKCIKNDNMSTSPSTYESTPINYSSLDKVTTIETLKNQERKRTESFKEAYENLFNAQQSTEQCMSIRNSVSNQEKYLTPGPQNRLKKVDIPSLAFEASPSVIENPPELESTYVNLDELEEDQTYEAFDKLLYDMSQETVDASSARRTSYPLPPPPPNESEYALIDDLSSDEELPPPLQSDYALLDFSDGELE